MQHAAGTISKSTFNHSNMANMDGDTFLRDASQALRDRYATIRRNYEDEANDLRREISEQRIQLLEIQEALADANAQLESVKASRSDLADQLEQKRIELRKLLGTHDDAMAIFEYEAREPEASTAGMGWIMLQPHDKGYVDMDDGHDRNDAQADEALERLRSMSTFGRMETEGREHVWQLSEISNSWPNPGLPWLRGETPPLPGSIKKEQRPVHGTEQNEKPKTESEFAAIDHRTKLAVTQTPMKDASKHVAEPNSQSAIERSTPDLKDGEIAETKPVPATVDRKRRRSLHHQSHVCHPVRLSP
jgi:hypothetical protein